MIKFNTLCVFVLFFGKIWLSPLERKHVICESNTSFPIKVYIGAKFKTALIRHNQGFGTELTQSETRSRNARFIADMTSCAQALMRMPT